MGPYKVIRAESFLCHAVYRPSLFEYYILQDLRYIAIDKILRQQFKEALMHRKGYFSLSKGKRNKIALDDVTILQD